MAIVCPFTTWKPIKENITRGGRKTIRGFVPHVQVGYGSLFGFFNTKKPAGHGASADFWCSKDGEGEQYVDIGSDQSWAQGSKLHNGNPYMVSCEFEGMPDELMTDAQIDFGGRLIAWLKSHVADWPLVISDDPEGAGVMPHYIFGGGHTCPNPGNPPGPRELQFPNLILSAKHWLDPNSSPVQEAEVTSSAVVVDQYGTEHHFYIGQDKQVWVFWYTGSGWSGHVAMGGEFIGGLSAVHRGGGVLSIDGIGTNHAIWNSVRDPNGHWTGFRDIGGRVL
jgi:hypothetical protein